ncbi:MAG: IS5 family transposase [Isosphaeraceae bacterium]
MVPRRAVAAAGEAPPVPSPAASRPPRQLLSGILFVLKTGIRWDDMPAELGWGCGRTCREAFLALGTGPGWRRLHESVLAELNAAGLIDWSRRQLLDSARRRARGGRSDRAEPRRPQEEGDQTPRRDRRRLGVPLATTTTGANRTTPPSCGPLVEAIPPVRGRRGRPRRRPKAAQGDRAYDSEPDRLWLRERGIIPVLARRNTEHGSGLGVTRWFVERTLSWLHGFGRLRRRLDRTLAMHEGLVSLGYAPHLHAATPVKSPAELPHSFRYL